MIYSSGVQSTYLAAKAMLEALSPSASLSTRRIETSEPEELTETYLKDELIDSATASSPNASLVNSKGGETMFAKPRGPNRRR